MRTDVPKDDPRILGTDKSRNESGRDLLGFSDDLCHQGPYRNSMCRTRKVNLPRAGKKCWPADAVRARRRLLGSWRKHLTWEAMGSHLPTVGFGRGRWNCFYQPWICPAFVTVTRFLDIPSYSLDKLCNYWSKIFEIFRNYAENMRVSCALCFIFLWNVIPKILTRRHYFSAHLCRYYCHLTTWVP